MNEFPRNTQELFTFAIVKARTSISEFGDFRDYLSLLAWAEWYASENKLELPPLETFGIYEELWEEDSKFLFDERVKCFDKSYETNQSVDQPSTETM